MLKVECIRGRPVYFRLCDVERFLEQRFRASKSRTKPLPVFGRRRRTRVERENGFGEARKAHAKAADALSGFTRMKDPGNLPGFRDENANCFNNGLKHDGDFSEPRRSFNGSGASAGSSARRIEGDELRNRTEAEKKRHETAGSRPVFRGGKKLRGRSRARVGKRKRKAARGLGADADVDGAGLNHPRLLAAHRPRRGAVGGVRWGRCAAGGLRLPMWFSQSRFQPSFLRPRRR